MKKQNSPFMNLTQRLLTECRDFMNRVPNTEYGNHYEILIRVDKHLKDVSVDPIKAFIAYFEVERIDQIPETTKFKRIPKRPGTTHWFVNQENGYNYLWFVSEENMDGWGLDTSVEPPHLEQWRDKAIRKL